MYKININKEDLIGVWENKEVAPFTYNDNIEITLFLGANNSNNVTVEKDDIQTTYFSDEFEVSEINDGKFTITFKNSELIDGKDALIKCRMFIPNKPFAFVANIKNFGDRYFEKK